MAEFGPLTEPFLLTALDPEYYLSPQPQGTLEDIVPLMTAPPDAIASTKTSAFFIPPAAFGFMTDVDALELAYDAITRIFGSALVQEGSHMEPTIGQIWPR